MARRARSRNYKKVNAKTHNMGSAGAQVKLLKVGMLDPQIKGCYCAGVKVTGLIQTGEQESGGMVFYASTQSGAWSDDHVITASAPAGAYSGSVYLKVGRYINTDVEDESGAMGPIYIWGELTDITATVDVDLRVITETWGRNLSTLEY